MAVETGNVKTNSACRDGSLAGLEGIGHRFALNDPVGASNNKSNSEVGLQKGRPADTLPARLWTLNGCRHLLADIKGQAVYPGYSLFGKMRALAELRGLETGIRRALQL